ncbi:hypothetical protein FQZ97_1120560 [compost metagenome]
MANLRFAQRLKWRCLRELLREIQHRAKSLVGASLLAKRGHSLASQLLRAMPLLATLDADTAIEIAPPRALLVLKRQRAAACTGGPRGRVRATLAIRVISTLIFPAPSR